LRRQLEKSNTVSVNWKGNGVFNLFEQVKNLYKAYHGINQSAMPSDESMRASPSVQRMSFELEFIILTTRIREIQNLMRLQWLRPEIGRVVIRDALKKFTQVRAERRRDKRISLAPAEPLGDLFDKQIFLSDGDAYDLSRHDAFMQLLMTPGPKPYRGKLVFIGDGVFRWVAEDSPQETEPVPITVPLESEDEETASIQAILRDSHSQPTLSLQGYLDLSEDDKFRLAIRTASGAEALSVENGELPYIPTESLETALSVFGQTKCTIEVGMVIDVEWKALITIARDRIGIAHVRYWLDNHPFNVIAEDVYKIQKEAGQALATFGTLYPEVVFEFRIT
jgi:hypothetical protein